MKKTIVSVFSVALVAGMCVATGAFANVPESQGVVDIKVTNLSGSWLKNAGERTFGPKSVNFTVKENTFLHGLGYKDMGSFVVKYEFDKHIKPVKDWGASAAYKKVFKGKDGRYHYTRCTVKVIAGPDKPVYTTYGSLCKHLKIETSTGSGSISYVKGTHGQ